MAFGELERKIFRGELDNILNSGIFKEERIICSPQNSEIEVEFPRGSKQKQVINMCSNNYLGLSSHPEVVEAAHQGLKDRGYGLSSVRFICGSHGFPKQ